MHSLWSLHLSCSELWLHTPWWSEWPFIYDILDKGFKAFIYEYTTRATVFCERCCSVGCTDTPLQECQCREIALATSLDNSVHRVVGQDARGPGCCQCGVTAGLWSVSPRCKKCQPNSFHLTCLKSNWNKNEWIIYFHSKSFGDSLLLNESSHAEGGGINFKFINFQDNYTWFVIILENFRFLTFAHLSIFKFYIDC